MEAEGPSLKASSDPMEAAAMLRTGCVIENMANVADHSDEKCAIRAFSAKKTCGSPCFGSPLLFILRARAIFDPCCRPCCILGQIVFLRESLRRCGSNRYPYMWRVKVPSSDGQHNHYDEHTFAARDVLLKSIGKPPFRSELRL
jgi:hypothetical protein